jgi:hypothetical protein
MIGGSDPHVAALVARALAVLERIMAGETGPNAERQLEIAEMILAASGGALLDIPDGDKVH